jgi:hypothetical protein
VEPAGIATSIVWRVVSGGISFPEGNTGEVVKVKGNSLGDAKLEVSIPGIAWPKPTVEMSVTNKTTVSVRVFIISDSAGSNATTQAHVTDLLNGANRIYEQAAMTFVQQGNAEVRTNDNWFTIEQTNGYKWQEFDDMCSSTSGTGGIELYFVKQLYGGEVLGLNSSTDGPAAGCGLADNSDFMDLAHELGHACNLLDVYDESENGDPLPPGLVREVWLPRDWNSGPGPLYYSPTLEQSVLVTRLAMYGYDAQAPVDIPKGRVYGYMWSTTGTNRLIGMVPVGLQDMERNPHHW